MAGGTSTVPPSTEMDRGHRSAAFRLQKRAIPRWHRTNCSALSITAFLQPKGRAPVPGGSVKLRPRRVAPCPSSTTIESVRDLNKPRPDALWVLTAKSGIIDLPEFADHSPVMNSDKSPFFTFGKGLNRVNRSSFAFFLALILPALGAPAGQADWPEFRGPRGDG